MHLSIEIMEGKSLYCIYYYFRKELPKNFDVIRDRHLSYVKAHREKIVFGGILREANLALGVLYVTAAQDREEAQAFIERDPYFCVVDSYQIHGFETKIQS